METLIQIHTMKQFAKFSSKWANIYSREARGAESNASGRAAMPGNCGQCSWAGKTPNPCTALQPLCIVACINIALYYNQYIVLHYITIHCVALYFNTLCCNAWQGMENIDSLHVTETTAPTIRAWYWLSKSVQILICVCICIFFLLVSVFSLVFSLLCTATRVHAWY